ncbi:MAG: FAD:protein FMN transferase [Patescibacteria group bacterium]|nr:FAD:protein FMN transferase [Patescibacteria group bacterium]
MNETRIIMGMPVTIRIVAPAGKRAAAVAAAEAAFAYFVSVDERFSTYKDGSEISRINRGEILEAEWSADMKEVMAEAERTKRETGGRFDIVDRSGSFDPSGLVKGWAIARAARMISDAGFPDSLVDAGGDIQASGTNERGEPWEIGIRSPFDQSAIVKTVRLSGAAIATSGTYVRGQHIYDPLDKDRPLTDVASLTVVGPDIYDADRFATAAFAMGADGISFIGGLPGLEGYQIGSDGIAAMTAGFFRYTS